jgi:teichuronic acid biosynthesis glycosyltransferase TuaC
MEWKHAVASPRRRRGMRILWTHNFDPAKPNSQVFMNIAALGLSARGIDLHFEYLGKLRSVTNLLSARRRLRGLVADFDLVHAQYGSACSLATAAMDGLPKVLSVRGNDWNVHNGSIGFFYFHTRLARAMTRWSLGRYDCVLTVSRRVAADVKRFSPRSSVWTVPSPIDLNRFVPRDKKEARALLGFPDCTERWVLFNALNLDDPIKRFPLAKEAFELAKAKCGNLRLRVATDLPHSVLPLFTAACDVILCTSETEGWPNCVKEALACNVPFVSTDVSDLRDIARQEATCRICPADQVVLADNICDVLASQREPDLRRHVADMSLDSVSDRLVNIYESLLAIYRREDGRRFHPH